MNRADGAPGALVGIVQRLWHSQTVENTFWIGAASAMSALLGAVSTGLYARTLGVEEYGVLTLIISLVTMMIALSDLGIGNSIVRFGAEMIAREDPAGFRSVLNVALRAKLVLGAVILTVSILFINPIVGLVFTHVDSRITAYFLLSLGAVACSMLAAFFPPIFQAHKRFRPLAAVSLTQPALKVIVLVIVAAIAGSLSVTNALWIEICTAAGLLAVSYAASPEHSLGFRKLDRTLSRRMFSFNKWLSLYYILNLVGGRMDIFFVGGLADGHALGIYGAASKIASIVVIVTNSYLTVLLPEISSAITPEQIRRKQRHSFLIVAMFAFGIAVLAAAADFVEKIVFGPSFGGTAAMIRVMCIGLLFTVGAYPINATLFAWNRSEVFPLMSAAGITALIGGNALLIPRMGVLGAAVAFSLSGLVGFLMSCVIYFHHLRTRVHDPSGKQG